MIYSVASGIKRRERPNDIWYSPPEIVRQHISMIPSEYHKVEYKWLDPFYGTGLYFNGYPHENKDFTEIEMGKDFFEYQEPVDVICSNPPYSMLTRVFDHSISLRPRVISYLIGIMNLTPARIRKLNNAGYGLTYMKIYNVRYWFATTVVVVFEMGRPNIIDYDTTMYFGSKKSETV